MKALITIIFCLPLILNGQCTGDTLRAAHVMPEPCVVDTTTLGSPLLCYTPCMPYGYSVDFTIEPMVGYVQVRSVDSVSAVLRSDCDSIVIDTCLSGIFVDGWAPYVPVSSGSYSILTVFTQSPAEVKIVNIHYDPCTCTYRPATISLSTLCSTTSVVDETVNSPVLTARYDLLGRPYNGSGICIEEYRNGTRIYFRKTFSQPK